jgi:hypothetical protein
MEQLTIRSGLKLSYKKNVKRLPRFLCPVWSNSFQPAIIKAADKEFVCRNCQLTKILCPGKMIKLEQLEFRLPENKGSSARERMRMLNGVMDKVLSPLAFKSVIANQDDSTRKKFFQKIGNTQIVCDGHIINFEGFERVVAFAIKEKRPGEFFWQTFLYGLDERPKKEIKTVFLAI